MDFDESAERQKLVEIGLTDEMIDMIIIKKRELHNKRPTQPPPPPQYIVEKEETKITVVPVLELDEIPPPETKEPEYFPSQAEQEQQILHNNQSVPKSRPSAFRRMKY